MATFNTRGDQPGHARQAVEAALDLQRESARAGRPSTRTGRAFGPGSARGEVLVGVLGADRGRSYTVIGDTVNVAARLEALAPGGRGDDRGRDCRGRCPTCRCGSLGGLAVKGRAEPVEAHVVEEAAGPAGTVA